MSALEPKNLALRIPLPPALVPVRSARAKWVARCFGLSASGIAQGDSWQPEQLELLIPSARQIVLITGPSGAGKSRLLRSIVARIKRANCIDLNALRLPDRPLVDCFRECSNEDVLSLLSRVGLSEAWTYLRKPSELSDGQRWRLRLAVALHRAQRQCHVRLLICDEFAALLDRVTASVVSHALRRTIDHSHHLGAIIVTSHDDLTNALAPDLHVYCDFGSATLTHPTEADARSRSAPAPQK
jgi:ABC-type ATPase with predicted acetyltransferase domain